MNITTGNADSNSPAQGLRYLLRRIIDELATEPERTRVDGQTIGLSTTEIVVTAWSGDYWCIYGEGNKHRQAMKIICKLVCDNTGANIKLTMPNLPREERAPDQKFEVQEKWKQTEIHTLVDDIFKFITPHPYQVLIDNGDHGQTAIDVVVSERLSFETAKFIKNGLDPMFKAIGLKNGRHFSFAVIRNDAILNRLRNKNEEPPR